MPPCSRIVLLAACLLLSAGTTTAASASAAAPAKRTPPARASVFGGSAAAPGAYPWMVGLSIGCGGSLVAPDRVLTAAHCLKELAFENLRVRVGAQRVRGARGHDGQAVGVLNVGAYPGTGTGGGGPDDEGPERDVALIQLTRPVTDVPALPLDDGSAGGPGAGALVIGFGASSAPKGEPRFPDALREGTLAIYPDETCARRYERSFAPLTMICAGDRDGRRPAVSPCVGDSGGPLLVADAGGALLQAGVVSFGTRCGLDGEPAVYARVAALREFILDPSPRWAPTPVGRPRLTGTVRPGRTVRCTGVTWRNAPEDIEYRWRVGGEVLRPTGRSRRTVPRRVRGRDMACRVAAANAAGLVRSAVSPPRRVVRR